MHNHSKQLDEVSQVPIKANYPIRTYTHYGKPQFRCQACERQFVEKASRQPVDEATC